MRFALPPVIGEAWTRVPSSLFHASFEQPSISLDRLINQVFEFFWQIGFYLVFHSFTKAFIISRSKCRVVPFDPGQKLLEARIILCCAPFLTQLSQHPSSNSFFVDVPEDLLELLLIIVEALKDLDGLGVVVAIQVLGEVRFKPGLCISPKVGCSNHNLVRLSGVLSWVKAMDQLDLHQVGPKPGSLSMKELHIDVVLKLSLVVRGS